MNWVFDKSIRTCCTYVWRARSIAYLFQKHSLKAFLSSNDFKYLLRFFSRLNCRRFHIFISRGSQSEHIVGEKDELGVRWDLCICEKFFSTLSFVSICADAWKSSASYLNFFEMDPSTFSVVQKLTQGYALDTLAAIIIQPWLYAKDLSCGLNPAKALNSAQGSWTVRCNWFQNSEWAEVEMCSIHNNMFSPWREKPHHLFDSSYVLWKSRTSTITESFNPLYMFRKPEEASDNF